MINQILKFFITSQYPGISFWFVWADIVSLGIVVAVSLYVFLHSYYRTIPATLYKVLSISPVALIIPSVVFTLGSITTKLAMVNSLLTLFIIGLVGLVISIAAAVAYGINAGKAPAKNICPIHNISYEGYVCPICASAPVGPTIQDEPPTQKTRIFSDLPVTGYLLGISSQAVHKLAKDTVIGRGSASFGESSKIQLGSDDYVSRVHARIVFDGKRHKIADSSSKSGTFVNGTKVSGWTTLEEGDVIKIGKTSLKYTKNK